MKPDIPDELHQLLDSHINLPSPPTVAVKILHAVRDTESSLGELERIISADPALTGKMLRIANSAFYSLPNKVSNITRAISLLGTNVIKNIALSFAIAGGMRGADDNSFDFDSFWRRAVTAAVAAELVMSLLQKRNEDIFVTALLQDIGILALYQLKGVDYTPTLEYGLKNGGTNLVSAEKALLRFDHQQLGGALLERWEIPEDIYQPVRYHHDPRNAPDKYRQSALVLEVADLLSASCNSREISCHVRELQEKMNANFGIDAHRTRSLLDDVAGRSIDILRIFEIDPGQIKPYSQILQEANEELGKLNLSYEQLVLELTESQKKAELLAQELKEANSRLEQMAFRDGLTNLYNHRFFQETLKNELARARRYNHPLSLIIFDIDHFKRVNDSFGHRAGDQVLAHLAGTVSATVRPSDLVARYGGEEFVIILPETTLAGMKLFAERLRSMVAEQTTMFQEQEVRVTISIGGAHFTPEAELTQQQLVDRADRALYRSKRNGRNRVTVEDQ